MVADGFEEGTEQLKELLDQMYQLLEFSLENL